MKVGSLVSVYGTGGCVGGSAKGGSVGEWVGPLLLVVACSGSPTTPVGVRPQRLPVLNAGWYVLD